MAFRRRTVTSKSSAPKTRAAYQRSAPPPPPKPTFVRRPVEPPAPTNVVAKKGDSFSSLSSQFGVPHQVITAANAGVSSLSAGMNVNLPKFPSGSTSSASVTGANLGTPGGGRTYFGPKSEFGDSGITSSKVSNFLSDTFSFLNQTGDFVEPEFILKNGQYIKNPELQSGFNDFRKQPGDSEEPTRYFATGRPEDFADRIQTTGRPTDFVKPGDTLGGPFDEGITGGRGIANLVQYLYGQPVYEFEKVIENGQTVSRPVPQGEKTIITADGKTKKVPTYEVADEDGFAKIQGGALKTGNNLPPKLGDVDVQAMIKTLTESTPEDLGNQGMFWGKSGFGDKPVIDDILYWYDPPLEDGQPWVLKTFGEDGGGGGGGSYGGGYGGRGGVAGGVSRGGAGYNTGTNQLAWRIATG